VNRWVPNCSLENQNINFLQRRVAKFFSWLKRYCNIYDIEIIEALERIFILKPEKTGDFEGDETDRYLLKTLRLMFVFVVVFSVFRIFLAIQGEDEIIADLHKMITSFFFGWLFIQLHIETKNQSLILFILALASFWFGLW